MIVRRPVCWVFLLVALSGCGEPLRQLPCSAATVPTVVSVSTTSGSETKQLEGVDNEGRIQVRVQCSRDPETVQAFEAVLVEATHFEASSGRSVSWELTDTDFGDLPWSIRAISEGVAITVDLRQRPEQPEALLDEILST